MQRRRFIATAGALGLVSVFAGCSRGQREQSGNLVDVASAYPQLSTFVSVVETAGLSSTLRAGGPYTVFAPTNSAFAALPEGALSNLLQPQNREILVRMLGYHALPRVAPASQFAGQQLNAVTAEGQSLRIDGTRGRLRVNDANVLNTDIRATNGLIHVVDRVLIP